MFSQAFRGEIKELKTKLEKAYDQRGDTWRKARNKTLEEENRKLVSMVRKLNEDYEKNKDASNILEESGGRWDNSKKGWLDKEEVDKYDGDDWSPGYGFTIKDGEYRICMAGGGDHWFDYVMNKNGCFIENTDEKKKVFTFVSCPDFDHIKVWDTPEMEGGLSLDEGETDMYEMVKECFQEEIMEYEEEE